MLVGWVGWLVINLKIEVEIEIEIVGRVNR